MPCDNNGSHPVPPPTPSPPPPADAFELRHADSAPSSDVGSSDAHPDAPATCLDTDLSVKPCAPAIDRVWYFGRNGHASGQVVFLFLFPSTRNWLFFCIWLLTFQEPLLDCQHLLKFYLFN